ncbi:uncharacterized protein LOC109538038 [Dendroctonus ponderosae]
MTSVTIPSGTGPPHGGYTSARDQISNSESEFESTRSSKRCRSLPSTTDSCKKRRKQSTPIRIYNSESESAGDSSVHLSPYLDSKPAESPENIDLRCHMCQLEFETSEQLQNHISRGHHYVGCKTESEEQEDDARSTTPAFTDVPLCLSMHRPEIQWTGDMHSKDWGNHNMQNMSFSTNNPVFMTMPQFHQPENVQIKPIRIFNVDAYCGLCNKEFCNKYFLKTHKANKHGIYTDLIATEHQLPTTVNMTSTTSTMNLKLSTSVPSLDVSLKNESKTSINALNPYGVVFPCSFSNKLSKQSGVLTENELNDVQNPISVSTSNGPSSSSESDKLISEDQGTDVCASPGTTQAEPTSTKNESDGTAVLFYDSAKMSPSQSNREMDISSRLRRIGVMNPKAYCEICNKEYCNKYFLRTHKMKRHGIFISDEKDQKMEGLSNNSWPSTIQTSPLNLIVTEQAFANDRKTTSPNDISCEICGIKFQNTSLAHLHNYTVHSKTTPKDFESNLDMGFGPVAADSRKLLEKCRITTSDKSRNPDAISEDLQKLQSMILQLNDLDVTKVSTTCSSCNKEFENRFYLHAHMVTEHGLLLEDNTDLEKSHDSENSSNANICDLCGKDFQNSAEMKAHILEVHSNLTSVPDNNKEEYGNENISPDKPPSKIFVSGVSAPERRLSVNVTPTSSYCEICNKELCNKYFMKTHMQRMHGIEIENGAQIGGVVCDICNKELCSKYFLRVHKHNTHGIVEYGASLLQPRKPEEQPPLQPRLSTPEPEPSLKPSDLADLSQRYFTHFTEVCPMCSRRFRSTKWLKSHMLNDHGQAGADKWLELEQQVQQSLGQNSKPSKAIKIERASPNLKVTNGNQDLNSKSIGIQNVLTTIFGSDEANSKSYQCSYCPYTSTLLPLLFIHERTHTINENIPLKCPVCPQSFLERDLFQRHMYSHHPFLPPLFNGHTDINNDQPGQQKLEELESLHIKMEENSEQSKPSLSEAATKNKSRISVAELPMELSQSLQDVARKAQLPATYALPQPHAETSQEEVSAEAPGYVMQAFLLEDSAADRRVVPAVVFLPMLQKQPSPLTVTFTLTPA